VTQELQFTLVRTDIAGFVGLAERGPLPEDFPRENFDAAGVALKITSWKQFQANFGGFLSYGYLAYAVRAFFENGGHTCYVVRVAASAATNLADRPSKAFLTLPAGPPSLAGTLGQVASPFLAEVKLEKGQSVLPRDLVALQGSGSGFSQINQVEAVLDNGQFRFAKMFDPSMPTGASVTRFPSAFNLCAKSRGSWGNRIQVQITQLDAGAFALRALIDHGPETLPTEVEFYRRLTLNDSDTDFAGTVLEKQSEPLKKSGSSNQSNLIEIDGIASPLDLSVDPKFASGQFHLQGGRDGVSQVTLNDFTGGMDDLRGLRLLQEIDEIAILSVPDSVYRGTPPAPPVRPTVDPCQAPPGVLPDARFEDPTAVPQPLDEWHGVMLQQAMIDQCERLRYRVAVIDPPDKLQIDQIQRWPAAQGLVSRSSRYAAIYYPWLKVPDALAAVGVSRRVPPSGHVAGAYAYNDLTFGVQRPPANIELNFVTDVAQSISDAQQSGLNDDKVNVNAIRAFPGRGIRVWGARSLAPLDDSDWRFIHVRRLMSAIEETLERYSRWVVFQNNNATLRASLKHSLEVMLHGIWAKGGLKGGTPAQAFFVKCDETNNSQTVIDRGQLICQIGVAIAAPMEFIVFEIRQAASGAQVLED
jgi:hypothetical protein